MVKVAISACLVEQVLRTGYSTNGVLTVLDGIDPTARLVDVELVDNTVYLYFEDIHVEGKEITVSVKRVQNGRKRYDIH
jgi:hypothetical protein